MFRFVCALIVAGLVLSTTAAQAGIEIVAKSKIQSVKVEVKKDKDGFLSTHYTFTFSQDATKISEEACRSFATSVQPGKVGYSMSIPKRKGKEVSLSISGPILGSPAGGNTITLEQVPLPPAPLSSFTRVAQNDVLAVFDVSVLKDAKPADASAKLKTALAGLLDSEHDPLTEKDIEVDAQEVDAKKKPGIWRFTLKRKPKPQKAPAPVAQPAAAIVVK